MEQEEDMDDVKNVVAYWQNGRSVTYGMVTTEDLRVDAVRYGCAKARAELARRGIAVEEP